MYQHKQIAWTILIILAWVSIFVGMSIYFVGSDMIMLGFFAFIFVVGFLFHGLTVIVDQQGVQWYFGPKIGYKKLAFNEIKSVAVVSNSFRHGVGIRITHDGWVYSANGFSAVAIELHDGTFYRIGSNEADVLCQKIEQHIGPIQQPA